METLFKEVVSKLNDGCMSLDAAMQWMKEAKIIDNIKVTEEQAREVFKHADDKIDFAKFEEGLKKIAEDSKQGVEELQQKLEAVKPQITSVMEAGTTTHSCAFKTINKAIKSYISINKALEDAKQ